MPGDVPQPKRPEHTPTPLDLARRLGSEHLQARRPATTRRDVLARGEPSAQTHVTPREKSALAQQLEGTRIEGQRITTEHLDRLGWIDVSSLSEPLQEVTTTIRSELTRAINHSKDGRIDEKSLQMMIGRIGGPYTMYLKSNDFTYPEQRLIDKTSGAVSELRHANRLIESNQATSAIILGAQQGQVYTLQSLKTGASEHIQTSPVKETDILYLGRDGKVHIDEVKETVHALCSTLRSGPDQLQHLAIWQNQAPERREARVVLDRPTFWAHIFEKLDTRQPTSPSTADLLVEHRISLHIGSTTIKPESLGALKDPIQQALERTSGARREVFLKRSSQFLPPEIEQGRFQI